MEKLIAWVEIPSTNFKKAVSFYESILDIEMDINDYGNEKMAHFPSGEGAIIQAEGYNPSAQGVLVSLNTGDKMDACLQKITANGGKILIDKCKIEAPGRDYFAIFLDSEGNKLGLYGK